MTLDLLKLLCLFGVGFLTWGLALVRTLAIIHRQVLLLCSLIFVEEIVMLMTGIWLARFGGFLEVIFCASGGVLAAYLVTKYGDKR